MNGPLWWGWPLWAAILVFAGIMAVALTLMKLMGLLNGASPDRRINDDYRSVDRLSS